MKEFEIKFLNINVSEIEEKLVKIGAKKVGDYGYRRAIFDYPDLRMNNMNAWIRLRTDGKETTLTYKHDAQALLENGGDKDAGVTEIEVIVDSYEKTYEFLKYVGFIVKREEENKRIRYTKENVVFDIDLWPMIPAYIEIESVSIERAREAGDWLDLDRSEGQVFSPKEVYRIYGINADEYSEITFEKQIKK